MSSVTRSVATGARGKRHNRSGLFTRIIFAVNILIRSLGAAEKAADIQEKTALMPDYEAPVDNASAATSLAGVAGSVMTFVLAGTAGGAILAVKKRKKTAAEKKE